MRPIFLAFSGLNSYRSRQQIDFQALAERGLFGIFGATGAGKSTILDAMTLALFGEVNRAPRQTQGIINAREQQCAVSFTFELNGNFYTAERIYERQKGDMFSSRIKSCRFSLGEQQVLADRNDEMNRQIIALLGMDRKRFCQTVILPQGQFDQLLQLKPAERNTMFEELFHFEQYGEQLTQKLKSKLKEGEAELDALNKQLSLLGECDDKLVEEKRAELETLQQAVKEQQSLFQRESGVLDELRIKRKLCQDRASHIEALTTLAAQATTYEKDRFRLQLAEKAEPLRALLENAKQGVREAQEKVEQLAKAKEACTQAEQLAEQAAASHSQAEAAYLSFEAENEAIIQQLYSAVSWQEQEAQQQKKLSDLCAETNLQKLEAQYQQLQKAYQEKQRQIAEKESNLSLAQEKERETYQQWQAAQVEMDKARVADAAAYLSLKTEIGDPCPVCGETVRHLCAASTQVDMAAAISLAEEAKASWDMAHQQVEESKVALEKLRQTLVRLTGEQQAKEGEISLFQKETAAIQTQIQELHAACLQICPSGDPQKEIDRRKARSATLQQQKKEREEKKFQATAGLQTAKAQILSSQKLWEEAEARLNKLKEETKSRTALAGFASGNEAMTALLSEDQRTALGKKIREYDQQIAFHQTALAKLADPGPLQELENLLTQKETELQQLQTQRDTLSQDCGRVSAELTQLEKNLILAKSLRKQAVESKNRYALLKRLGDLLKGNAFVRYLSHGALSDLAHDASHILSGLTNHRYRLELIEDAKGSDFIMADDHNGGLLRQVSGLSGGETFLVSLALALALSKRIQMNGAELKFFFLDEGFGSLDGNTLEAALSVLEKLPSNERTVGVITHVAGVKERMPRYLEVLPDAQNGSQIRMKSN